MVAACRDVFNRLDADKSGGVSIEELSRGLVDMGYLVSKVCLAAAGASSMAEKPPTAVYLTSKLGSCQ